ncbi:MAG TPA: HAD hydrolase-like protein [Anaerolineae bacterium]|nr:HAD hydrolase-like protein [Anaerolineae bacterium]
MIKYLIWDLDGTLFDTYPAFTDAFLEALNDFQYSADPEWVLSLTKVNFSHCASVLASHFHLTEEEVENAFWRHYLAMPLETQVLMPGAKDLCEYIVGLGGMNVIVTHRDRPSTIDLLGTHGVEALFADFIAGDDGYPMKPDPGGVEVIIERNRIDKEQALLVGDRDMDIEAGLASGVRTCLFGLRGGPSSADYLVDDLNKLRDMIREENRL